MKYDFPIIRTVDDVLPSIEGRKEFVVKEKEHDGVKYLVANYNVEMPDSFPPLKVAGGSKKMREARSHMHKMRREVRGLIFNKNGELISRPLHKFFNINQKDETLVRNLDFSIPNVLMDKLDGSMVRPFIVDGMFFLGTKMGFTDISMQSMEWLDLQDSIKKDWMVKIVEDGYTPIFEWISPENNIVLHYDTPELILLNVRNNLNGTYHPELMEGAPFKLAETYGALNGDVEEYLETVHNLKGKEGHVICFDGVPMLKAKADEYLKIHKIKDNLSHDRHIVLKILSGGLDDVYPVLDKITYDRVKTFEQKFWKAWGEKLEELRLLVKVAYEVYDGDRKAIALKMVPTLKNKSDSQFIFSALDGKELVDVLDQHIIKMSGSHTKYDEHLKEWLGI